MKKTLLLTALAGLLAAGTAAADPCTGVNLGTSDTSDVTLNGIDATECQIVAGNSGQAGGNFIANFGGDPWTQLYNQDPNGSTDVNTTFGTLTFSNFFINFDTASSGTFGFDWSGGPAYVDFVYSMHAGNESGYWFFDEVLLSPASGSADGTWVIHFVNNGGQTPGWSNGQFWVRAGDTPPPDVFVPEPASLWLTGIGLIALASLRRRRG